MNKRAKSPLCGAVRRGQIILFLVQRVPGRGPEQRESGKTVLYLLISIILFISYIIIQLLFEMRTIPSETGNGTPENTLFWLFS